MSCHVGILRWLFRQLDLMMCVRVLLSMFHALLELVCIFVVCDVITSHTPSRTTTHLGCQDGQSSLKGLIFFLVSSTSLKAHPNVRYLRYLTFFSHEKKCTLTVSHEKKCTLTVSVSLRFYYAETKSTQAESLRYKLP